MAKMVLKDTRGTWRQYPFAIGLGESFKTYQESVHYSLEKDMAMSNKSPLDILKYEVSNKIEQISNKNNLSSPAQKQEWDTAKKQAQAEVESQGIPDFMDMYSYPPYDGFYTKPNMYDSSVGGNDAINPYWQFCEDDDLIHPMTSLDGSGKNGKGMGRVYAEMYNDQQKILWIQCGVAEYTGPEFFLDESGSDFKLHNDGEPTMMNKIGKFFGSTLGFTVSLPLYTMQVSNWFYKYLTSDTVSKYIDFRPSMYLYYRTVNVLLSHMAVNLGLFPVWEDNAEYTKDNIPNVLADGPDIYKMLMKRANRTDTMKTDQHETLDDHIVKMERNASKVPLVDSVRKIFDSFTSTMFGGMDFIGFKVERNMSASENMSNSTKLPDIAHKMNDNASQELKKKYVQPEVRATHELGMLDQAWKSAKGVVADAWKGATSDPVSVDLMMGNGFYDFPEIWGGSNFSRSCSFNLQLRARYGDNASVFQSICVPLALLLAMTWPRQVTKNMYTAPYYIQAYCKGMFAVTLGLIENLSISRGTTEFGWNKKDVALAVDVRVTIKDLSPLTFLNSGNTTISNILNTTDATQTYLSILCGMGLQDLLRFSRNIKRRVKAWMLINKNTTFSPMYWSYNMGNTGIPRLIGALSPFDKWPRR